MVENEQSTSEIIDRLGHKRENLLPILQEVVKKDRYLSEESLKIIAKEMVLSAADVYGVASFYSFLDLQPRGQNIIRICKSIICFTKRKDAVIEAVENRLKIKLGETTPDNKFSFLATNCIGWCHEGPAMLINNDICTKVTPETAIQAIEEYL